MSMTGNLRRKKNLSVLKQFLKYSIKQQNKNEKLLHWLCAQQ